MKAFFQSMKSTVLRRQLLFGFLALLLSSPCLAQREADFNFDWKFSLNPGADASSADFDDGSWRSVNLPHDWVIEGTPDPDLPFWQATGRLPGKGVGWYRKTFNLNAVDQKTVKVVFDGVYNNSDTWINGNHLGFHPNGYSPFIHDLTPFLVEGENVIAVRVDHSAYADSRWYTGAGVYRDVTLVSTGLVHVPVRGVFVTTPRVSGESALVNARVSVRNADQDKRSVDLRLRVIGPDGGQLAVAVSSLELPPGETRDEAQNLEVLSPLLWGIETPVLYTLVTEVIDEGNIIDVTRTRFGIRHFRFDANKGFFLNGENLKIKGVCLHHDGGLVGAAVPDGVWRRRLEILREAGVNALRAAHNPPSEAFLDLADEMGFLVQNEFFDEWDYPKDKRFNQIEQQAFPETNGYAKHFRDWAERDLKSVMRRDRNHPSIIQWSIGNEVEWTYPRTQAATGFFDNMNWQGNYFWSEPPYKPKEIQRQLQLLEKPRYPIGTTARQLADWTRVMDTTRPVTANLILPSASLLTDYGRSLDVAGFSYRRVLYDYLHETHPDLPIMGTENLPQYHEWKAVAERDFVSGIFLWTGIRYMGELRGDWPVNTSGAGLLDLAGFKDWGWHMFRSLWRNEPHLVLASNRLEDIIYGGEQLYTISENGQVQETSPGSWKQRLWTWWPMNGHWNYSPGDTIVVEAYSNVEELELFQNGKSLGKRSLSEFEDHVYKWAVPYEKGQLRAVGSRNGRRFEHTLTTHGSPRSVEASLYEKSLEANGYDTAHIEVQLIDADGHPVLDDDRLVRFKVPEDLRILGVDNGAMTNVQKFQTDFLKTAQGRALLIVQARTTPGVYEIEVESEGLESSRVKIRLNPPH